MIKDVEKMEFCELKKQWIKMRIAGDAQRANSIRDRLYAWFIIHLDELTTEEVNAFATFFQYHGYL